MKKRNQNTANFSRTAMFSRRHRAGQGGQVLVFALVVMIAVLVGALLVFDIHTVLMGKVKGQNAVDAAAMTSAKWQQHALNLIGELNLVKATTVLISDPMFGAAAEGQGSAGGGYDFFRMRKPKDYMKDGLFDRELMRNDILQVEAERERLLNAVSLLSQMQTRISFVLPLLGYGAAQQAAKNNGITANYDAGEFLNDYYNEITDDALYGNPDVAPVQINGYAWREPYAEMLYSLMHKDNDSFLGIAAGTKIERITAPGLTSDPPNNMLGYLTSKRFYEAILANSWCELRSALLDRTYSARWWGSFDVRGSGTSFIQESEILPLHIGFFTGSAPYTGAPLKEIFPNRYSDISEIRLLGDIFDSADPYPYYYDPETKNVTMLFQLDKEGRPVKNASDTDYIYNYLPDFTWCVYDGRWYTYPETTEDLWRTYLRSGFREGYNYYSGALSWFAVSQETKSWLGYIFNQNPSKQVEIRNRSAMNTVRNAQNRLKDDVDDIEADALAKPFGRVKIGNKYLPPFRAGNLVLPVFTEVALIPVSLEPVYGLNQMDRDWIIFLTKYLPLLGNSNSLDTMERKIRDKEREDSQKYGKPQNYWSSCSKYHHALEKFNDPEWRQKGIDWLNTPVSYDKENGQPTKYRKDTCDAWPSGGGGHRAGPGSIH